MYNSPWIPSSPSIPSHYDNMNTDPIPYDDSCTYDEVHAPSNKKARQLLEEAKKAAEKSADVTPFFKQLLR